MRHLKSRVVLTCLLVSGCGASGVNNDSREADDGRGPGVEQRFTDDEGVTSRYRVWPARGEAKGLLVVLDGDGQHAYDHPEDPYMLGGPDGLVAAGTRHGLAVVAVRTPDDDGTPTWWEDSETNGAYLHELLGHLDEDLSPGPDVWLVGYSGGAQQITQTYLPLYSEDLESGGAVVFGGGGPPEVDTEPVPPAGDFPIHWYSGAEDTAENSDEGYDAVGDARDGAEVYREAGFQVTEEYPDGVDHDLSGDFGPVVEEQLAAR